MAFPFVNVQKQESGQSLRSRACGPRGPGSPPISKRNMGGGARGRELGTTVTSSVEVFRLPMQSTLTLCVLTDPGADSCRSSYNVSVQISPDYEPLKEKTVFLMCSTSQQLMNIYWTTEWMEEGKEG